MSTRASTGQRVPPASRRPALTNRRVHKWIAVPLGAVLLVWIVSGIVLILPDPVVELAPPPAAPDYGAATVSPAAAIQAAGVGAEQARFITLSRVHGQIVYRIITDEGSHLVHAVTGEPYIIDAALAERIARERLPGHPVARVERLTEYDIAYFYGPLPTYRVVFDDGRGTYLYVSPLDGSVQGSNRLTRMRTLVTSLHDFTPIAVLFGGRSASALLLLAGTVALGLIWTGYVLAWPRRRRPVTTERIRQ